MNSKLSVFPMVISIVALMVISQIDAASSNLAEVHQEQNREYVGGSSKGQGSSKGKGGYMPIPAPTTYGKGKGSSKGKGGSYSPYSGKMGGKGKGGGYSPYSPYSPYSGKMGGKGKGGGYSGKKGKRSSGENYFSGSARYKANFGKFGKFDLKISDSGTMKWSTNLKNIDKLEDILMQQESQEGIENGDFPIISLSYHLHSMWRHDDSVHYGTGGLACGNDFLGGHYDPTLACGGASSAQANGQCAALNRTSASGYTYSCAGAYFGTPPPDFMKCEIGDLSGKYGSLSVQGNCASDEVSLDPLPALNAHYDESGYNENDPAKFSAVLIHNGGPRVLCGKLVRVD